MKNNLFEIIVGTFVLLCAVFFASNSLKGTRVSESGGYFLIAKFDNVDGISAGSDVKIAGVKVGHVDSQTLDNKSYRASVKLSIYPNIKIPLDSSIKIVSEGLLGSKFLQISPGGDIENLNDGEEIEFTQSSTNLEELLGKFIFGSNDKNE